MPRHRSLRAAACGRASATILSARRATSDAFRRLLSHAGRVRILPSTVWAGTASPRASPRSVRRSSRTTTRRCARAACCCRRAPRRSSSRRRPPRSCASWAGHPTRARRPSALTAYRPRLCPRPTLRRPSRRRERGGASRRHCGGACAFVAIVVSDECACAVRRVPQCARAPHTHDRTAAALVHPFWAVVRVDPKRVEP